MGIFRGTRHTDGGEGPGTEPGHTHGDARHTHGHAHADGHGQAPGQGDTHDHGHLHSSHAHDHGHSHDHGHLHSSHSHASHAHSGHAHSGHAHSGHAHSGHAHDHGHSRPGHAHDHGHGHDHSHGPGHSHGLRGSSATNRRRLALTLCLMTLYMVAEVIGGLYTNSLALLADAGHMLSDAAALGLSLFAMWIAQRPATPRRSYGYYRAEILAALVNGGTLVAVAIFIFVEAVQRFQSPPEVAGAPMMAIAAGGLVVNLIGLAILSGGRGESLNLRGAWLHMLMDSIGSAQAIVAGLLIWQLGWTWVDPLASILIGLLVIYSSWSLLREATAVLMEDTPGHIDPDAIRASVESLPGVVTVHDLHVWTITSGLISLSAHVQIDASRPQRELLQSIQQTLREGFGIDHSTLQLDTEDCDDCGLPV